MSVIEELKEWLTNNIIAPNCEYSMACKDALKKIEELEAREGKEC